MAPVFSCTAQWACVLCNFNMWGFGSWHALSLHWTTSGASQTMAGIELPIPPPGVPLCTPDAPSDIRKAHPAAMTATHEHMST
jgi:hypothetical protein